jgi:putative SOS response-associated peptidase YedK
VETPINPETKQRSLDRLRWGLVPYWAKDEKIGFKTINARAETVDTAHSFRSASKKRRCLIPAGSFYEWKKVFGGKIPYSIEMKDGSVKSTLGCLSFYRQKPTIGGSPEKSGRRFYDVPGRRHENETCLNTDKQTRK